MPRLKEESKGATVSADSVQAYLRSKDPRDLIRSKDGAIITGAITNKEAFRSKKEALRSEEESYNRLLTIEKMKGWFAMGDSGGRVVDYADGAKEYVPNLPDGTPQATTGNVFYDPNDPKKGGSRTKKARGGVMRRKGYQAGGVTDPVGMSGRARLSLYQTGAYPRPGITGGVSGDPVPLGEPTLLGLSEQERAELLAASQQDLPYGGERPDDWLQGLIYDGFKGLRDQAAAKLAASDPAPGTTGGNVDPFLGGDRSGLGQVGGLEEIVNRYETPRTSDVEPGVERISEPAAPAAQTPLGGYQTPSSLLDYIEHMKEKSAAPQEMQYGGSPMPWRGAPPQRMQAGPPKNVSMGRPPQQSPMGGGMGIQAGPLPPGMGPGSGGMGGGLGQLMQQKQQMMQQQMMQQRRGAMGRRGRGRGPPPQRMMPQRPQAMGQPPGGGAGGGGGMPGGPRVPPNLRGALQQQQMQNRPAPGAGGNRIGGGDQRGAMARARQSQTGRQPISRRSAFPGRAR